MTREQYEMLQWLPKGEQAAMLQQQNAEFADGNADDLSAMRSATNAGVDSVFDQERNGTFDAVSDPNSETIKSETTTTNADGTKTTTTTSNPTNSPSARIAEDAKNPDQIRVSTQDGRFSAMIDPSMLEQYAAAGYKPGPQTATPNGGTMTTPGSEFDQSTLGQPQPSVGLAQGGGGRAVVDTKPEPVMYSNGSQFPAYAVPGSPEAIALEAQGYAQGGAGQASLVKPGVIGGPVLDTQQDAQQDIITTAGEQAAQDALIANEGLGNSAITNQQAQDGARGAAEIAAAGNFADVAGTTQEVIDQGIPGPASEFDSIPDDAWAAQEAAEDEAFMTQNDAANAMEAQADAWAEEDYQEEADKQQADLDWWKFENDANGDWEDGATEAAIERDKNEGGFFEQIMNSISDLNEDTIQPWLESVNDWYKDNPVLATALATAASNYVTTGKPFSSIGAGVKAAVTTNATIEADKAKNAADSAKAANDLATWEYKDNKDHAQAIDLQNRKLFADNVGAADKAKAEQRVNELNTADELAKSITDVMPKEDMIKYFPAGFKGEVSDALHYISENSDINVGDLTLQQRGALGKGITRYAKYLKDHPDKKGKIKLGKFFEDEAVRMRANDAGVPINYFPQGDEFDMKQQALAFKEIKQLANNKQFPGVTTTDQAWNEMAKQFKAFSDAGGTPYNTVVGNATDAKTSPFLYYVNNFNAIMAK